MTRSSLPVIFSRISLIILIAAFLFTCSGSGKKNAANNTTPEITLETPTQTEVNNAIANNSVPLADDGETIKIPVVVPPTVPEICDNADNNNNGLIDENCFGCYPGMIPGDFDHDGKVTMYDAGAPLYLAYTKTIWKNSTTCADLDKDGLVGMGDTLKTLDIVNAQQQGVVK
jgi:hypothetical protein